MRQSMSWRMCARVALWMVAASCVQAQAVYTWTNLTSVAQNWSGENWSPAPPPNGGGAEVFLNFGVNTGTYTANNDFSLTPFAANGLSFTTGTVTLTGSALCLTHNGAALPAVTNISGKTATVNNDIVLATNVTVSAVHAVNLTGAISGPGGLTKAGASALTLTHANSYSGGTLVVSGALSVAHSLALGAGRVTVVDGSFAKLQLSGGIAVANPLTVGSEKPGWADNVNSVSGENVLGGLVTVKESNIRASAGSTLRITNGINGTAYLSFNSSGTIKVESVPILLTNQAVYFGGGNPGTIQLNVVGNVFSTAYFWGGRLLALGVDNALPTGVTLAMQNGQTGGLNLNGFNQMIGSLNNGTNYLMITNSGSLARFTVNQSGSTVSSARFVGTVGLVKTGPGALTVSNVCTHSGGTIISNGVLRLGVANALPATGSIDVSGGVYDLGGYTVTNGEVTVRVGGGVINGTLAAGSVELVGTGSVRVALGGSGRLAKSGQGTADIMEATTYSGATDITGGTLRLEPLPPGTVAFYGFDDASSLGKDCSLKGNTLKTVTGAPQYSAGGRFGGALYLNGSSTLGTLSDTFPDGVPTGNAPYTVSAFIKVDTGCSSHGGWIGYGNMANSQANNFRMDSAGFTNVWNYWWANDMGAVLPGGSFTDGWHSVVGTWDGTTQRLYIDGVDRASRIPIGLNVGTNLFVIGKTIGDANFKGWVDDLLIANRALTAAEIAALHATGAFSARALPSGTSLRVASGATLDLRGASQSVSGLAGEGSVTGGTLTVTGRLAAGDGAGEIGMLSVHAGLALAAGVTNAVDCTSSGADAVNVLGTLTVQGSVTIALSLANPQDPPREVTLFTFNELEGGANLANWSVEGIPAGYCVSLSAHANDIVLTLARIGTMILIH